MDVYFFFVFSSILRPNISTQLSPCCIRTDLAEMRLGKKGRHYGQWTRLGVDPIDHAWEEQRTRKVIKAELLL